MVGKLLSFGEGLFSGAMLVDRRVSLKISRLPLSKKLRTSVPGCNKSLDAFAARDTNLQPIEELQQPAVRECRPKLGGGLIFFFNFQPYLGKISNLTNVFQMGWNHQLVKTQHRSSRWHRFFDTIIWSDYIFLYKSQQNSCWFDFFIWQVLSFLQNFSDFVWMTVGWKSYLMVTGWWYTSPPIAPWLKGG